MNAALNTGNAKAALAERGDDLYETPACATEALLRVEKLPEIIWELACGPGAIVRVLRAKLANQFVGHALMLAPKVVMLLRLAFLEGTGRSPIMDSGALARVYVFKNRLPMMHRAGRGTQVAKTNSSAMAFAWFVWDRTHKGPTEMRRISWE